MKEKSNKYLLVAVAVGLIFHTSAIFYTIENTYDALIHLFFGNHYANSWFEPWNYSWYTGFTVMGYPPLVHQLIGLLSLIGGLKFGMFTVAIVEIALFITGVYKYSLLITGDRKIAGYASLVAVFSSSFVETLHIFGQLPSIMGVSILMHALPKIYQWIKTGEKKYYFTTVSLMAVTVCSHHVTPLFGMIFFIFPLIGMAVMDHAREKVDSYKEVRLKLFIQTLFSLLKRIIIFGFSALFLLIFCILPYWINSKNNPITQVPIPHGSRDNFLEVTSSGLVFFVVPWGILLFILPYIFYRYFSKRYLFFGLSITLLTILGTGGTTPIPLLVLGETAFNILTLDRFTLWASIMSLPIFGEFVYRLLEGDLKSYLEGRFGSVYYKILSGLFVIFFFFVGVWVITLGYFRPFQPQKINTLPIVNFLNQDEHDRWRYLPLGFGDQMAVLSYQTKAMTVDGNYHSARRLPELTSRAIERLENSKFRGLEGIGSLQQFLTAAEKYNLKYVFSNDKFYDPILYFCGWHRLTLLPNNIMVWEKLNVAPLPKILPFDEVAMFQKLMWGIIPVLTVIIAFMVTIQKTFYKALKLKPIKKPDFFKFTIAYNSFPKKLAIFLHFWTVFVLAIIFYFIYLFYIHNASQISAQNVVKSYYDALDFKKFEEAHSYLDPASGKSIAQFMLEGAVKDGVLNSYAKLDSIGVQTLRETENAAKIKVGTKWITPLEIIHKEDIQETVKRDGEWYIVPKKIDLDIPPDQFLSSNITEYFKQGRRAVSVKKTYHEDIMKQPLLEILSAKLISYDDEYIIIGELQNVDNVPADAVLKATLYDENDKVMASFNTKYVTKHKLMPKEITSFKVNFENVAWSNLDEVRPSNFNPDEFTPVDFEKPPVNFDVQSAGNVAITDLYNKVTLSDIQIENNHLKGALFNFGIQESTIPEILVSYYNVDKELIYVDHFFMLEGVRVQRKNYFDYELLDLEDCEVLMSSLENCFVNGVENKSITKKVVPNRNRSHEEKHLQKVEGKGFEYIKIEINNYVGNPR